MTTTGITGLSPQVQALTRDFQMRETVDAPVGRLFTGTIKSDLEEFAGFVTTGLKGWVEQQPWRDDGRRVWTNKGNCAILTAHADGKVTLSVVQASEFDLELARLGMLYGAPVTRR